MCLAESMGGRRQKSKRAEAEYGRMRNRVMKLPRVVVTSIIIHYNNLLQTNEHMSY